MRVDSQNQGFLPRKQLFRPHQRDPVCRQAVFALCSSEYPNILAFYFETPPSTHLLLIRCSREHTVSHKDDIFGYDTDEDDSFELPEHLDPSMADTDLRLLRPSSPVGVLIFSIAAREG